MKRKIGPLLGIIALFCGCASGPPTDPGASSSPLPSKAPRGSSLKVALFPWIPDSAEDGFASLRVRIEKEFERQYPNIDLVLRLQESDYSYYNPAKVAGWLGSGQYDVVEIDTLILGDLIDADVIEVWPPQAAERFLQAAVQGATVTDQTGHVSWWGVPHLLCGFFIVSKSPQIDSAESIEALVAAVRQTAKPLLGNFDSSWDLPSLYLDARIDGGLNPTELAAAVKPPLHRGSAASVKALAQLCEQGGSNPCVDGTYDDDADGPVRKFVEREASSFWGYSERLHLAVKELKKKGLPTDDLRVNAVPLGSKPTSVLFTDAFVRRVGCARDTTCAAAASAFVDFINSDGALAELLLSRDANPGSPGSVPRYLLPALKSAFEIEGIKADRLYGELKPFAEAGVALPNRAEMYERRRALTWLLQQELTKPSP